LIVLMPNIIDSNFVIILNNLGIINILICIGFNMLVNIPYKLVPDSNSLELGRFQSMVLLS